MPDSPPPQLLRAFDARVTSFQTQAFSLAEDLEWLDRLRTLGAPVGVILHSTRILEVLGRQALLLAGLADAHRPGQDVPGFYEVLRLLQENNHLPKPTYRLLDRLRDLGNMARHVKRKVNLPDAEQGYAIALRGLQWYFCEFPCGPKLKFLSVHNQPLDALLPFEVANLLNLLESNGLDKHGFLAALDLGQQHCPLLLSPVLAAVFVEKLLDAAHSDEAQIVLTAALQHFADDVRLRQLQGLLWSRTLRLEEACAWLERIEATDSEADEETQGILAGAYKRRADADQSRREQWLQAAQAKYERGWQQSRETNTYLGINAAALAAWLGCADRSAAIAVTIRDRLEARRLGLAAAKAEASRFLNRWDQLTLAEAHLLLQEWDAARERYREGLARFAGQAKALEVAREQSDKDLKALGRGDLIGWLFPA